MKRYFHFNANIYNKSVRAFVKTAVFPAFVSALILSVILLLSLRALSQQDILLPFIAVICAILFLFALITRILIEVKARLTEVHSRYTYLEIEPKFMVFSEYAGTLRENDGRKTVYRRLIVFDISGLLSAEATKKGEVLIKGKPNSIKEYAGISGRLGYYIKDGNFKFKEAYYEERGFTVLESAILPARFGKSEAILSAFNAVKAKFDEIPALKSAKNVKSANY